VSRLFPTSVLTASGSRVYLSDDVSCVYSVKSKHPDKIDWYYIIFDQYR